MNWKLNSAYFEFLDGHQLGHSSIKITYDTYGHWIPGKFKSEVDELDNPQQSAPYTQPNNSHSQIIESFQ